MARGDVVVDGLWKTFRIYQQRSSTLKQAVLRRGREAYDEFWALRDVSFEVPHGTTVGLIGSNGAGKSTMLKVLSRILVPDKGSIQVNGRVSALLELGSGFHPELSGRENIYLNGTILGMTKADLDRRFDEIVEFSGLGGAIDKAVKTYSSGMQARLGFSVAVSVDPEIFIIDEVLAVGDEQFQRRCLERMAELRSGGRTCIFVSHGLPQVQQICDSAVWLDGGEVRATGDTEEVINAYLRSIVPDSHTDAEGRQRQGSGEVQIGVEILANGAPSSYVNTGDHVTVRLSWVCNEPVDDAQFSFAVHSAEGIVVAGHRYVVPDGGALAPGAGSLDYTIPALELLQGSYHVSATVGQRHSGHVFDSGPQLAHFVVQPSEAWFDASGYLAMGGGWTQVPHG